MNNKRDGAPDDISSSIAVALFLAVSIASLGVGCSDNSASSSNGGVASCTPGTRVECGCPGGTSGRQTCREDGTFGPCQCGRRDGGQRTDAVDSNDTGEMTPDAEDDAPSSDTNDRWPPSDEPTFRALAVGTRHTCAVADNGDVMCWGDNSFGQVGLADSIEADGVDISAGADHSCLVDDSGTLHCWGANTVGQLGQDPSTRHDVPVSPSWLNDDPKSTVRVASGLLSNVALTEGDKVAAWGENDSRQSRPGFGNLDEASWRAAVLGLLSQTFRDISAGARHICAIRKDRALRCWGNNRQGQLGFGPCPPNEPPCSDNKVAEMSGSYSAVGTGAHHTCAITADGTIECRGSGQQGQLGDRGATDMSTDPVEVSIEGGLVELGDSLGDTQCGIDAENDVICWGANDKGQATGRSSDGDVVTPTRLGVPGEAVEVASGVRHSCARFQSGHLRCWGSDADGQLGDFALSDS